MLVESEFAGVLKQTERSGNNLSAVVRDAWDKHRLTPLTKRDRIAATDAHVSIIGHITREETARYLSATESANGFANRFMWFLVKRSKLLPFGGSPNPDDITALADKFKNVTRFVLDAREMTWSEDARGLWADVYPVLARDRYGLVGSLTSRAEAHVLRLSLIYAVLAQSREIEVPHLSAALALWKYSEESVSCIFGDATGNPLADDLLRLIRKNPNGINRTELSRALGNNVSKDEIDQALGILIKADLAKHERRQHESGRGAPSEYWFPVAKGGRK